MCCNPWRKIASRTLQLLWLEVLLFLLFVLAARVINSTGASVDIRQIEFTRESLRKNPKSLAIQEQAAKWNQHIFEMQAWNAAGGIRDWVIPDCWSEVEPITISYAAEGFQSW